MLRLADSTVRRHMRKGGAGPPRHRNAEPTMATRRNGSDSGEKEEEGTSIRKGMTRAAWRQRLRENRTFDVVDGVPVKKLVWGHSRNPVHDWTFSRWVGRFIALRFLRNIAGAEYMDGEFMHGCELAFQAVVAELSEPQPGWDERLKGMMGEDLLQHYREVFQLQEQEGTALRISVTVYFKQLVCSTSQLQNGAQNKTRMNIFSLFPSFPFLFF